MAKVPTPSSSEDAAAEYFTHRVMLGDYAPRPRVERWREDQRVRFVAELERLEEERRRQQEQASGFAEALGRAIAER